MQSGFTNVDPPRGSRFRAFGTFLETLREGEAQRPAAPGQSAPAPADATPQDASHAPSRQVLEYLAQHGAQPAGKVVETLNVGILKLGPVLNALVEAGLVEVQRSGSSEVLGLTKLGSTVMSLS
jgi:hypothetical protein